jgi:SOS-response transcriptional repressor LexA
VAVELASDGSGYVAVSPSMVDVRQASKLFALRASGNSMNQANINGNAIEDGDLIVVRKSEWGEANSDDYIVSLIGDYANIKRLKIDRPNHRLILMSESSEDHTPIVIADEDLSYYLILGKVSSVVKSITS